MPGVGSINDDAEIVWVVPVPTAVHAAVGSDSPECSASRSRNRAGRALSQQERGNRPEYDGQK